MDQVALDWNHSVTSANAEDDRSHEAPVAQTASLRYGSWGQYAHTVQGVLPRERGSGCGRDNFPSASSRVKVRVYNRGRAICQIRTDGCGECLSGPVSKSKQNSSVAS